MILCEAEPPFTKENLLERVERQQLFQHLGLRSLPDLTRQEHLVHDGVNLVEVKHQIELAHIVEVLVQHLDKVVDRLQIAQVVVVHVHADAKVQPGVPPVHDLKVPELNEIGVLGVADRHHGVHLLDQLLLLVVVKVHVPLGQAGLPRTVLDQDETDLRRNRNQQNSPPLLQLKTYHFQNANQALTPSKSSKLSPQIPCPVSCLKSGDLFAEID